MEVASSPILVLLALSVALLVFHISLQGMLATKELGSQWNAGPRDDAREPVGKLAGRAARASANYRETYPGFVALALALAVAGDPSGWGLVGAWLWFVARLVYIPLYLAGIPYIRSLVWLVALAGLAIMAATVIF
ncbi:MAPEG family protein [Shinella curvata]|uniref:MAPEG family protein n=1 Tax=Shinella curvata TaxID=1817964 RepID=A0ABT8XL27_9HYPH|nr:MAPEG family protein [Shinella curvata]MCJ8056255.1 MAPEG family protein [Shinella curvata]MDO6123966.1 MAPEG family protein [Shinella curvata]